MIQDAPPTARRAVAACYAVALAVASVIVAPSWGRAAETYAPTSAETLDALRPLAVEIGGARKLDVLDAPRPVPTTAFSDAEGAPVVLADFKGKVVLLNFWATFCAPCLEEMPSLNRLQAQLGGEDFQVVAVDLDRRRLDRARQWLVDNGVDRLGFYHDQSNQIARDVGLVGMPTTLLIDRSGQEVARLLGAAEWDEPPATTLIKRLIEDGAAPQDPQSPETAG